MAKRNDSETIRWSLVEVDLSKVKPNAKNPKIRDKVGMRRLKTSLKKFGIIFDGILNKDFSLIDGHSRLDISGKRKTGMYFMPSRLLTQQEYLELNAIYDLAKAGEPDMLMIEEILSEETFKEYELESERGEQAVEDDFEPPPIEQVKTDIVPGDLFEIGRHRLICGDSTKPETFEKLFAGKLADMVVTDPPYNVAYVGKTKAALTIDNDKQADGDFYQFLCDFYTALAAFTKSGGAWYVWHADSEGANFRRAMADSGIMVKQCLIWVKNTMVMGRQDYQWKHEPCLYGWKEGAAHTWCSDRKQTTVLNFERPTRSTEHPTMKPVPLIGYQIGNSSKVGAIVADGFAGSGTTMVAAEQLKRRAFLCELDPRYCKVIIERMLKLLPGIKVKKNGKPYKPKK